MLKCESRNMWKTEKSNFLQKCKKAWERCTRSHAPIEILFVTFATVFMFSPRTQLMIKTIFSYKSVMMFRKIMKLFARLVFSNWLNKQDPAFFTLSESVNAFIMRTIATTNHYISRLCNMQHSNTHRSVLNTFVDRRNFKIYTINRSVINMDRSTQTLWSDMDVVTSQADAQGSLPRWPPMDYFGTEE